MQRNLLIPVTLISSYVLFIIMGLATLPARFAAVGTGPAISISSPVLSEVVEADTNEDNATGEPSVVETVTVASKVKGIYVTGDIAGIPARINGLIELVQQTELNALVIDVKNDRGEVVSLLDSPGVAAVGAARDRVPDMPGLIKRLTENRIYPIARIVVFKDPLLTTARSDLAVRTKGGAVWKDRKGTAWIDPYNREAWDYILEVAAAAASWGFREIQFDYVRFPSDGQTRDVRYPTADQRSRSEVIVEFLNYVGENLRTSGVVVSADIFGLTTTVSDDMGIGQEIEQIAAAVDVISPMLYPSHYSPGNYGLADPDAAPYETVHRALRDAVDRVGQTGVVIRPWLQDFSLRNPYGAKEVRAQIQAVYDNGLEEWILWDPRNTYTVAALEPEKNRQDDPNSLVLQPVPQSSPGSSPSGRPPGRAGRSCARPSS